jgi:hypothetical protein
MSSNLKGSQRREEGGVREGRIRIGDRGRSVTLPSASHDHNVNILQLLVIEEALRVSLFTVHPRSTNPIYWKMLDVRTSMSRQSHRLSTFRQVTFVTEKAACPTEAPPWTSKA